VPIEFSCSRSSNTIQTSTDQFFIRLNNVIGTVFSIYIMSEDAWDLTLYGVGDVDVYDSLTCDDIHSGVLNTATKLHELLL
jgi:hypothetical protein